MIPTPGHVEAAKSHLKTCGIFNRDHSKGARLAQLDKLSAFLAARDARIRAEAFEEAINEFPHGYENVWRENLRVKAAALRKEAEIKEGS